jgi:hypothetical protein
MPEMPASSFEGAMYAEQLPSIAAHVMNDFEHEHELGLASETTNVADAGAAATFVMA